VSVQLEADRSTINADGEDVSVITVSALDAKGLSVPDAANKIHFSLTGPGKIIGVGNGDPSSHEADVYVPQGPACDQPVDWQRSLFNGLAQVLVQSSSAPGDLILTATADDLAPASLKLFAQSRPQKVALSSQ
jgi:beta-galactosidase